MSFAGSINNCNNNNLQHFLFKSLECYMKFDIHTFGASFEHSKEVNYDTNLKDFIIYSLMMEKAIEDVRIEFIGIESNSLAFCEALFYHVSSTFDILYEQNLDLSAHRRALSLGFERGASLIDALAFHLIPQIIELDNEECTDIYDFSIHNMEFIEKGKNKVL